MQRSDITAVILAGGRGERMGGVDKGLLALCGRPLIEHVLDAIRPQVAEIIISANRHQEDYARYGHAVLADGMGEFWGPLAGVATAMGAAKTPYLLTVPCDTPRLPADLAGRMAATLARAPVEVCIAHDGARYHNAVTLVPCSLRSDLLRYLEEGNRKAEAWLTSRPHARADFSDCPSAFININTPEDCRRLEGALGCQ